MTSSCARRGTRPATRRGTTCPGGATPSSTRSTRSLRRLRRRRHRRPARHHRAGWPYLRDLGVDARLAHAVLPLAAGRRRLRRRRLPRRRPAVRHARRRRRADRRARTSSACGSSSTWCPTTPPTQHAWFRAALAAAPGQPGAGPVPVPRRPGPGRRAAAEQLASRSSAARPGPGSPSPTAPASGTCTCSTPASPTWTGTNPEVRAEFDDVLRFWLDRGVDGFRVDVAHGLVKAAGLPDWDAAAADAATTTRGARATADVGPGRRARDLPRLARSSTATPATGCSSPRPGCRRRSGWPATSARTSCTRRSTSSTC